MATADKLVKSGIWPDQAKQLAVGDGKTALTAAGSAQTDALALTADVSKIGTAAASTGVILRKAIGMQVVYNGGAQTVAVYPPLTGTINSGAANAAFNVATTKSACFYSHDGVTFVANLSA
jgi:hypothetical protein